ncbi:MAG: hypothetical protein K1X94_22790 [Sandaracinaceae bacterium]|nr:hypothetical protein [Sandaracinaceae bacterium]
MRIDRGSWWLGVASVVCLASCSVGCGGGGTTIDAAVGSDAASSADAPSAEVIEIEGQYSDGFATHEILGDRWTMNGMDFSSGFTLTHVDNAEDFAIAQNDATNAFSPSLFSRFEWVRVAGDLYYCQSPYDAATEAAALEAARPDRSDPANSGCGMFGWSLLRPAMAP